ncbi:cell wall hydrolase [Bacillus phage SWEP1]|nr:cell wall hydrolase [Bacillus phage SWEP1]
MDIIIEARQKIAVYQAGDIIESRGDIYIIYKVPNKDEYHLVDSNFKSWANGTWDDINEMIDDIQRNNPTFRHYSKDEYDLKLVKK